MSRHFTNLPETDNTQAEIDENTNYWQTTLAPFMKRILKQSEGADKSLVSASIHKMTDELRRISKQQGPNQTKLTSTCSGSKSRTIR